MRTLLLMRGAPGSGKSTWIRKHNLHDYTLCPDELRTLCASKELKPDGSLVITQERANENMVWDLLFQILEHRMQRGEFTVIDATCSKTKDIQKYRDLAEYYRYRTFIVDFTTVPLETCLKQNRMRPEWKWVPDEAIMNIYARFATQAVPGRVKVIQPDEFDTLLEQPFDVSNYKKLVFIGDIHGCFDTLMQYPDFIDGLAYTLNDWKEFKRLYDDVQDEAYQYESKYIEGFVFVDATGFMTKCKTAYYNLWKKLRSVSEMTLRCGYVTKTGMLVSKTENLFYGFCKFLHDNYYDKTSKTYPFATDIISLREKYLEGHGNK